MRIPAIALILGVTMLLAGCVSTVVLRNPTTGEQVTCGPTTPVTWGWIVKVVKDACVKDREGEGFVVTP